MAKKESKFTRYSLEFKLQVLEDYLSEQSSRMKAIIKKHGLKSYSQIRNWTRKYCENLNLLTQDLQSFKFTGCPKSANLDDMTIEEQNAYLRMENDILKT